MTNRIDTTDPADTCDYCHGGCTICTPDYTATQYRMVLRGLRAIERHAMTAPYGGEVPTLPRDAWWASMLASADRVVNAPDATGEQRADARRLARDLTDYAGECDTCECTGRITVTATDHHGEPYDGGAPCPVCQPNG